MNLPCPRFGCTSIGVGIEGAKFATVSAMSVTTNWLERMKDGLPKLERLKLQGCDRVGDDGARILAGFPALREVDLKGAAVSDKLGFSKQATNEHECTRTDNRLLFVCIRGLFTEISASSVCDGKLASVFS